MKNLKAFVTVLLFGVFAVGAAQTQEKPALTAEQKQEMSKQNQQNRDRLGLTKDQQIPYRETIKRYAQLVREVRGSALSPDAKREKIELLSGEKDAEMKALLTVEQFKIYQEIQAERKAKFVQLRK